jgi:hypothetical protein
MSTATLPATATHAAHAEEHHEHPRHGFFRTYIWSHDHKMIALQYLFCAMVFGVIGGLLAMAVRWQLAYPGHPVPAIGTLLPLDIANADGSIAPAGYNMLHDHGVLRHDAAAGRSLRQLPDPVEDRRAGHGVPVF